MDWDISQGVDAGIEHLVRNGVLYKPWEFWNVSVFAPKNEVFFLYYFIPPPKLGDDGFTGRVLFSKAILNPMEEIPSVKFFRTKEPMELVLSDTCNVRVDPYMDGASYGLPV